MVTIVMQPCDENPKRFRGVEANVFIFESEFLVETLDIVNVPIRVLRQIKKIINK